MTYTSQNGEIMYYSDLLYRLSISLWAGGNAIFTLLLTPILFKTENRDTAARIVANLFPGYFRWGLACGAIALASNLVSRGANLKLPIILKPAVDFRYPVAGSNLRPSAGFKTGNIFL